MLGFGGAPMACSPALQAGNEFIVKIAHMLVLEFSCGTLMAKCSKMPIMHGRWLATSSGGPLRKSTTRSLPSSFRTDEVTTRPARKKFFVLRPTSGSAHLLPTRIAVVFVVPRFAVPEISPPHGPTASSIAAFPLALLSRPRPQNA
jgi:hypothetical protein